MGVGRGEANTRSGGGGFSVCGGGAVKWNGRTSLQPHRPKFGLIDRSTEALPARLGGRERGSGVSHSYSVMENKDTKHCTKAKSPTGLCPHRSNDSAKKQMVRIASRNAHISSTEVP